MDIKDLISKLNSPSDWAVVLGAGTLGLVVDGAINIIPIPFFSPGICGAVAASTALTLKRSWEAIALENKQGDSMHFWRQQANELIHAFEASGRIREAEDLRFEVDALRASPNLDLLEKAVREARKKL